MIQKETWKNYKVNLGLKFSYTALYVFLMLLSILLIIVVPFAFILVIPFAVLPFTFCYYASIVGLRMHNGLTNRTFFAFYPLYYQPFFRGNFNALIGFIKSVLVSIISSTILTVILFYTYLKNQPGFAEILQEIDSASTIDAMSTAMKHFNDFGPAKLTIEIANCVGLGLGIFCFVRHVFLHGEKLFVNLLGVKPVPSKVVNQLYSIAFRIRRKQFYKEYYGAMWYVILWFMVTFAGGIVFNFMVLNLSSSISVYVALAFALLMMFPFLPYAVEMLNNIYLASADDYNKASLVAMEKAQMMINKMKNISPEEKEKLIQYIASEKENLEKVQKEIEKIDEEENQDK